MRNKEEERKEKAERYRALNQDYKRVFGSDAGQRVLDDILSKGYLWTTTCFGDEKDSFREGKRDHALYIMKRVNTADSNILINLMTDNQKIKLERDDKKDTHSKARPKAR